MKDQGTGTKSDFQEWDTRFYGPKWLPASNCSQIEKMIDNWVGVFLHFGQLLLRTLVTTLVKPLRPLWIGQDARGIEAAESSGSETTVKFATLLNSLPYIPVICLSASRVYSQEQHREIHRLRIQTCVCVCGALTMVSQPLSRHVVLPTWCLL